MIRFFNVYYPTRTLILIVGEVLIISASFVLALLLRLGEDSFLVLRYEFGLYKILGVVFIALFWMNFFDLYDTERFASEGEIYSRLSVVLGVLALILAGAGYAFPAFMMGNNSFLLGLVILSLALFFWRASQHWILKIPFLRERVYILGEGDRARSLAAALKSHPAVGMDVIERDADGTGIESNPGGLGRNLAEWVKAERINRVIVAMSERRGVLPVQELLGLRLAGIKVEEATKILEKVSGRIEVDGLYPSWLLFSEGFRFHSSLFLIRRLISILLSLVGLLLAAPFLPLLAVAIKATSPGPVFWSQKRVGKLGKVFNCYKLRTMRRDAEASGVATWALDDDPRITPLGRWLRLLRIDELPQLWNVLRGDMRFVGPRPERPEFVAWLEQEIPYYHLRHIVHPGITGWAQVCFNYGASLEESKEKLKFDLYYIKNISVSLDLIIMFRTIKIILLGRGAR